MKVASFEQLVRMAEEQGWRIEAARSGGRHTFLAPDGQGRVIVNERARSRDLENVAHQLRRAGLLFGDEEGSSVAVTPPPRDTRELHSLVPAGEFTRPEIRPLPLAVERLSGVEPAASILDKALTDMLNPKQLVDGILECQDLIELMDDVVHALGHRVSDLEARPAVAPIHHELQDRITQLEAILRAVPGLRTKVADLDRKVDELLESNRQTMAACARVETLARELVANNPLAALRASRNGRAPA